LLSSAGGVHQTDDVSEDEDEWATEFESGCNMLQKSVPVCFLLVLETQELLHA